MSNNLYPNLKPIIIEFDQAQPSGKVQSQNLISKMLKNNNKSIKHAGPGLNKPQNNVSRLQGKPLYRPQVTDVYRQLGVNPSAAKFGNQSYVETAPMKLSQKINVLASDLKNPSMLHNPYIPQNNYMLENTSKRYQNVTHVQSSLDQITIENIQAKLQAHRRNLRGVQSEYNTRKGKSTPIDRYGFMKVNIDVEGEFAQLGVQRDKVYQMVRDGLDKDEGELEFDRLWEQKLKNDPKLAEYQAKFQEYLLTKNAKSMIGGIARTNLFKWDKYKQPNQPKSSLKSKQKHKEQSPGPRELTPSPSSHQNPYQAQQNPIAQQYSPKKDDKFITSYILSQLDKNKLGFISKQQLYEYLLSQDHMLKGYKIDTKWFYTDLDNFQTSRKGILNKKQLLTFLLTIQKISHPAINLVQISTLNNSNFNLAPSTHTKSPITSHFPKHRQTFNKIFQFLDFNNDNLIKRVQFIESIYVDADCVKILDKQAITINLIMKSISFRQIIGYILNDYEKQNNEKIKKSKQYITFGRFCQYFDIPETLDLNKIADNKGNKDKYTSNQISIWDIPEEYLMIMKDIYDQIPRVYQNYIVSQDFVQAALRDPQILALGSQLCRLPSIQTRIEMETLLVCLRRMSQQCDQFANWAILKCFFSRRGRPTDWDVALVMKKKELRAKKFKQSSDTITKGQLKEFDKMGETAKSISKLNKSLTKNKYTIPIPFNITDTKQKPNQEAIREGEQQFTQIKSKFKAQPVNKQILESKPELIAGKIKTKKQKIIPPEYKYENYENDRIERALKRAHEQYEKNQMVKAIVEKTKVKAQQIEIDLKKPYEEVIKEQQKKRKEKSKYKPTNPKISQNLYPSNPSEQRIKKIEIAQENIEKGEQIARNRKQQIQDETQRLKDKNNTKKQKTDEAKKRQEQQKRKRDKIVTQKLPFKPNINKKQLTDKQKQAIQKCKQQRQIKAKQEQQLRMKIIQEKKKKILAHQKKSQFIGIEEFTTPEQIIQNLDFINFQELLLDEISKFEYRKQFDNRNKTCKQIKERTIGLAGRQRANLEEQEKRIMEQKKKLKQKIQIQKTKPDLTKNNKDSKPFYSNDLDFHKSKALRRYRALMEGKKPESEFDKYSKREPQQNSNIDHKSESQSQIVEDDQEDV